MLTSFPSGVSGEAAILANAVDRAGGAVTLLGASDHVIWANDQHRNLMPWCDCTSGLTYRDMFWMMYKAGILGNADARRNPVDWIETIMRRRDTERRANSVNSYPWGLMAVSHARFDDGSTMQVRLPLYGAVLDTAAPNHSFNIVWAIEFQEETRRLRAAFNDLPVPVAITARERYLVHRSQGFADLIDRGDGFGLDGDGALYAWDDYDDIVLRQTITGVADGKTARSMVVPLRRPAGPPHLLSVSPGTVPGTVILAVAAADGGLAQINDALRSCMGLSATEAAEIARLRAGSPTAPTDNRGPATSALPNMTALLSRLAGITRRQ